MSPTRTVIAFILAMTCTLLLFGCSPGDSSRVKVRVDHGGVTQKIEVERDANGDFVYLVDEGNGTKSLTPEEFSAWLLTPQTGNWLMDMLNVSSRGEIAWVAVGLFGQMLFTGRMILQWIASERLGRSTIPTAFWWLSLGGAAILIVYFAVRREPIALIGQSAGCIIYLRNLKLIYLTKKKTEDAPA